MATKLQTIPKNMRVIQVGNDTYLQPTKRGRKRYKTPLAVRKRISASARKLKIPALTVVGNGGVIADALSETDGSTSAVRGSSRWFKLFGHNMTKRYLGYSFITKKWDLGQASGLMVNGAIWAVNRLGIFRGVNRVLGKAKIPVTFR